MEIKSEINQYTIYLDNVGGYPEKINYFTVTKNKYGYWQLENIYLYDNDALETYHNLYGDDNNPIKVEKNPQILIKRAKTALTALQEIENAQSVSKQQILEKYK